MSPSSRPDLAVPEVAGVGLVLATVLGLLSDRYGPHRDELYFVSAGSRLAWGYPDQPSFTPFLARVASEISPGSLVVLRLPSVLAMVALVVLSAALARLLGGARAAQVLTALCVASSAITLNLGHRLSTATFDTLAWTAILLVVGHALLDRRPHLWLLAGVLAGIGLNNKHAVAFLLAAMVVAVAIGRETRRELRRPWPWLGGLLALAAWVPNLLWQADHGWPALALSGDIADEYGGVGGRLALVGQVLVMLSPVITVLWVFGLVRLLRRPAWSRARPLATTFLLLGALFLVTGGKGYYLAGAIPPLVAAGSVALAERWSVRRLVTAGTVLAISALVAAPAMVPVLPASLYAHSFYPALDDSGVETIGWPELTDTVSGVLADLPPADRRTAMVFTGNYGEAGAMEWYDVGAPVYSGHNGWAQWGPPPEGTGPVVVVGWDRPQDELDDCRRVATVDNDAGADNEERGQVVWVCAGPRGSWRAAWPTLTHLDA